MASIVPGLFIYGHRSPVLVRHGRDGCEGGEGDVDVGGPVRVEEEPAPVRQHLIHLGQHSLFSLLEAGAAGLGGQVQYLRTHEIVRFLNKKTELLLAVVPFAKVASTKVVTSTKAFVVP